MSIEGADFVMRNWSGPDPERSLNIGSEEHKQMFCRMLLETHNPYKPAVIAWPALLEVCLAENARRMAGYDSRLRRPATVPMLARLALRLLERKRTSSRTGEDAD